MLFNLNKKKIISLCLFFIFILILFSLFSFLIHNKSFQSYVVNRLALSSGFKIKTGDIQFIFYDGIGIRVNNLKADSISGDKALSISNAQIYFDKLKLLSGRIVFERIILFQPVLQLNNSVILKPVNKEKQLDFENIFTSVINTLSFVSVKKGRIFFVNQNLVLDSLFFDMSAAANNPLHFISDIRGDALYKDEKASFVMSGNIKQKKTGTVEKDALFADMTIHTSDFPMTWLPKTEYFHFKGGTADANINLNASFGSPLELSGRVVSRNANYIIQSKREAKEYVVPEAVLDFKANYFDKVFNISSNTIAKDFSLGTSFKLDLRKKISPFLDLDITSLFMDVSVFKKIFPTPTVPHWIEASLFPIFSTGKVRCDHFVIKGPLERIRNLNQSKNKDVLTLKLSLKHIETKKENDAFPFTDISGKVTIENGTLKVSEVKGCFGVSSVNRASLDINSLYTKNPLYRYSIDGVFDLNDLKQQSAIDFAPSVVKQQFDKFSELSGKLSASFQFDYKKTYDYLKLNYGAFFLNSCLIMHKDLILPISINETEIIIDEKGNNRFKGQGFWGNSSFKIKGSAYNIYKKGVAEAVFKADINEIIKSTKTSNVSFAKFRKLLPGRFILTGDKGIWSCTGEAELKGIFVDIGNIFTVRFGKSDRIVFDMDIFSKEKIKIHHIKCNMGKSLFNGSGFFDLKKKEPFNIDATLSLSLEDVNLFHNQKEIKASGTITSNYRISTSLSDYSKLHIDGDLKAKQVSFGYKGNPPKLKKGNLDVRFSEKDALISAIQFMIDEVNVGISGRIQGWRFLKGDLSVVVDSVDFEPVISFFTKDKSKRKKDWINGFAKKSNVNINIKVEKGKWEKLNFSSIIVKSSLKSGVFNLDTCDIDMEKGKLKLIGYLKIFDNPYMMLSGYINLADYPLINIVESFELKNDLVVSNASLTTGGFLASNGSTTKEMVSNLSGSLNFHLSEGNIKKQNIIFSILNFMSLQNIIDLKRSYFSQKGFYFKSFKGNIDIEKGVLSMDNFVLHSPAFNAAGKGKVDFIKEETDVDLGVAPLGTIDSIITKVPILGYILTGNNKAFVTYYIKVKGPMANPKIQYVPFKHWPTGILGFFKRTFCTPGRLLKSVDKITDVIVNKNFSIPDKK